MSTRASMAYSSDLGVHVYQELIDGNIYIVVDCKCCDGGDVALTTKQFTVVADAVVNNKEWIDKMRKE